jgi:Ca-activated chloride channel homolog
MAYLHPFRLSILFLLSGAATAQVLSIPTTPGGKFGGSMGLDAIDKAKIDFDFFLINSRNANTTPLMRPSGSVSKFDLKAPAKAKREYQMGYQLLQRKDLQGAVDHLSSAIRIYANFVAAHNALGTAYLQLHQNQLARQEFTKAAAIDGHLPSSFLNLGIAQLSLKEYPAAEESLRKASSIAPLDLQVSLALAYGEFSNHDYPAVLATARDVHARKHKGAEMVHYYAAAAWGAQDNLVEAQRELETLLQEDPQSASADQFRQTLADMRTEQERRAEVKARRILIPMTLSNPVPVAKTDDAVQVQRALQDEQERRQIAEAEAEAAQDPAFLRATALVTDPLAGPKSSGLGATRAKPSTSGFVFRSSVDEVDLFFAATDRGKSVADLTPANIRVLDNNRAPDRIIGFRNESQLPLRLGLVIDASGSVKDRLPFEQKAAIRFLQDVLTDKRDLAFVVGVNNSVLMVQDFTPDRALISQAVNQLAPGGGTALWDAVAFASEKLGKGGETPPVARILVVISDGQDNSSSSALKEAIASALRNETVIYTVSTRELVDATSSSLLGDRALKALAELTGGAAFVPGSLHRLSACLADVQQVIRGRYLLTYKPAEFQTDGRYRSIEVAADRDGHHFRVFARKGYYAPVAPASANDRQ